jgi:predicted nucleic acid-binding protein
VKPRLVLDSGVLSLHFAGDSRLREFFDQISEENSTGLVSEVNLAEYFYKTCQKLGKETADSRYHMLRASKLLIVNDEQLTRLAGLEKCRQRLDLSLADCFALALAKRESATLLTTDTELNKTKEAKVKLFTV